MVDKTLKSFFAATGAWRKIPLAERASQGAKRSEKIEKVTLSLFRSVSTRAAVRRQVTVVRAAARGAKFPFSSRGPPKERKARSPERTFADIFCTTPYNPQKNSRPQARNDLDRFLSRQKVNCRKAAREAALGRVRDKKTPLTPQTCAPTARALPRRAIQNQKRRLSPPFLKCFTESRSASRSPPRSSSACSA